MDFTDSTAKQKLKLRLGTVPMPNARGELVPQETENRIELHYSRGRLTELSSEVVESRNPERVVFGRTHNYRWESGRCLPTRITMRNRVALADKTGVVFDSALCRRLRDRHGFNVAKAEECVQSVTDTYRRIVDFDNELREESGGEEFLVTVNPLAPGAVAALRGTPESAITVGWMAACADFLRAHEAPARPAAGPRAAGPDPASSARTAE